MLALERLDPRGDVDGPDVGVAAARAGGAEDEEERHQQGEQLEPVVERLHERHAAHAAGRTLRQTTIATANCPTHDGAPVSVRSVSPAPWNCGMR